MYINGRKVANPDFYLEDYGVYLEYWGLVGQHKYDQTMKFKMQQYYKHNIPFISIYPQNIYYNYNFFSKQFLSILKHKANKIDITIKELEPSS